MVVILAVGRAEQGGAHTGDRLDLIAAGIDVGHNLLGGKGVEVGMIVGVVHNLVSRIGKSLHRFGVFVHPFANDKKGDLNVVFSQNINELLGILVPPCCVEGEGHDLLIPLYAVYGQLAGGGGGADDGGVVDDVEHGDGAEQTGAQGQKLAFDQ